jgi:signal transduction histidine kinase
VHIRQSHASSGAARRLVTLLTCALLLAAYLAFRAFTAVAEQRTVATNDLRREAEFAAFTVAARAGRDVYWGLVDLFTPVVSHHEIRRGGPDVPLKRVIDDACEYDYTCALKDSVHVWFRVPIPTGAVEQIGRLAVAARSLDSIRSRLRVDPPPAAEPFIQVIDSRSEGEIAVVAALVTDSAGRAAVYGFEVSAQFYGTSVFRHARDDRPLLPASLDSSVFAPEVYAARLVDGDGHVLGGDTISWDGEMAPVSMIRARTALDSSRVSLLGEVGLRPAYVERRLAAASPSLGMGVVVVTFVLTAMVIGVLGVELARVMSESRRRADFTASVSHELRTPLTQILLFGESLRDGSLRVERDRRQATDVIVREARALLALVENLLRFSRAERRADGEEAAAVGEVSLGAEVGAAVEAFAPMAAMHRARVVTRLDTLARVRGDPASLRHLVTNLLDNAAKHGPPGQTITVGCTVKVDRVELWIDDEGPGIPVRDRGRVWEPFVRLERRDADRVVTGSGLGLTVVRQLTEAMGGSVAIDDRPGGGARFVVSLPLARPVVDLASERWRAS